MNHIIFKVKVIIGVYTQKQLESGRDEVEKLFLIKLGTQVERMKVFIFESIG